MPCVALITDHGDVEKESQNARAVDHTVVA